MLTAKKVYSQILKLTSDLIETGICDDQNFPRVLEMSGGIEEVDIGKIKTNIFLKNVAYKDMYAVLKDMREYNYKMIDGTLILMQYRFQNHRIISHRLSFFPSPNLQEFQNEPEAYLHDEIYADIVDKRIVVFPIRFDFDNDLEVAKPLDHPVSHLTLGQYKNCRIPVSAAITPYQFLSFVIRNFYHTAYQKYCGKLTFFKEYFQQSILDEEREIIHINLPHIGL